MWKCQICQAEFPSINMKAGHMKQKHPWTKKEDDTLRMLYPIASKEEILKNLPIRSWKTILQRAKSFKIRRKGINIQKCTLTKRLGDFERGFLVALIDGEGSIGLSTKRVGSKRKFIRIAPFISIVNTCKPLLEKAMQFIGGGSLFNRKGTRKEIWTLGIYGTRNVAFLLEQIHNDLIVKKDKGDLVLKFCKSRVNATYGSGYSEREMRGIWISRAFCKTK